MELWRFLDKKVKIVDDDNSTYVGLISDYIEADDNEDGLVSIVMEFPDRFSEEFNEPRIKSIEIL